MVRGLTWSGVILGEPASKSNQRRLVTHRGVPRFIKSQKAINYVKWAHEQLLEQKCSPLLEGDLRFTAEIYYASRRPDLDASVLLDALQGWVYKNDRQVREVHLYHRLDKKRPRAQILVEPL